MDKAFEKLRMTKPLAEDENHVSFFGVTLEKAKNREGATKPESYDFYVQDGFRWELMRDIATSWELGDPYLAIGGTSIGKTTTIKKMCAHLGYEVYYINCTENTDEEALLGKYVSNVNRKSPEDPEFVFMPGPLTLALMQEEGKVKVLFLDEINVSRAKVLSLLHDVADALKRNLPYDLNIKGGNEKIPTNHFATKVIAAANPVSGDMSHASPLSLATIRRFAMQRVPDELPPKALKNNILSKIGHGASMDIDVEDGMYMPSNKKMLSQEQLSLVPGITVVADKYFEFHKHAKDLLSSGQIGTNDMTQPFKFDDNDDVDRVLRFVRRFYQGDINKVFQEAIRYYYLARLTDEEDQKKLLEKASEVRYIAPVGQRQTADMSTNPEEIASIEEADKILGNSFLGPRAVEKLLQTRFKTEEIPPLNLTRAEIMKIRETGGSLVFVHNADAAGKPVTVESLSKTNMIKFKGPNMRFMEKDAYFKKELLPTGEKSKWLVVWDINGTSNMPFDAQEKVAAIKLMEHVQQVAESNPDEMRKAQVLEDMKRIEKDHSPAETAEQLIYRVALQKAKSGLDLYPNRYVITSSVTGNGKQVNIGANQSNGIVVNGVDKTIGDDERYITAVWDPSQVGRISA